jgi:hypothetical protein
MMANVEVQLKVSYYIISYEYDTFNCTSTFAIIYIIPYEYDTFNCTSTFAIIYIISYEYDTFNWVQLKVSYS